MLVFLRDTCVKIPASCFVLFPTLSRDLRQSFPDAKGFSVRNLQCMRQFYELFPMLSIPQQAVAQIGQEVISAEKELVQQAVAQKRSEIAPQLAAQIVSIPWGHICLIMNRCGKDQSKLNPETGF
ncbi:MAG: DUF1016 N-terminal domain-containing protein [Bacilli bacterium]|nr:DUF1016 N-terminal domain-containing protein [Bacilli bacterium]